jgi:large subunit ribosomal protein L24
MNRILTKIRLKKNDTVMVRSGKYKGQTGKILAVHPFDNTVTVDGINKVKKHVKPNRLHPQGSIIDLHKPIAVSKVGIVDPSTKKASRISYSLQKDGTKVRVFGQSKKEIK